jgi:hypothetical protein
MAMYQGRAQTVFYCMPKGFYQVTDFTFTPLRGNRFLCNYSLRKKGKRVIVKRGSLDGHRRQLFHEVYPRSIEAQKEKVRAQTHRVRLEAWDYEFSCPGCAREHRAFEPNAQFKCSCGDEIVLTRKPRY